MANKKAAKKQRSQKDHVLYHVGQMAFIGVIILIVWLITTIADAQGM